MVKRTKQKSRGIATRKQRKLVLIGAEGKNKTEIMYFREFNHVQKTYMIKAAKGNSTDPEGIVKDTIKSIRLEELNFKEGDMAFCAFDTDMDHGKQVQIDTAVRLAKAENIEVILSSPCFEVWFLQHFEDSTAYLSGDLAVERLRKYIPAYEKGANIFHELWPYTEIALERAKRLKKYHDELGRRMGSIERNPGTEADRLVEKLITKK